MLNIQKYEEKYIALDNTLLKIFFFFAFVSQRNYVLNMCGTLSIILKTKNVKFSYLLKIKD